MRVCACVRVHIARSRISIAFACMASIFVRVLERVLESSPRCYDNTGFLNKLTFCLCNCARVQRSDVLCPFLPDSLSTQPIPVPHCTANESRDKSCCLSVCACQNRSIGLMVRAVGAVVLSVRIQGPINTPRWWNGSTGQKG